MERFRLRRRAAWVGLHVALGVAVTCGVARAQGRYAPVTHDDVEAMKLAHYFDAQKKYHPRDFEWTFTRGEKADGPGEFVLKSTEEGVIPADLRQRLFPADKAPTADDAAEIRGRWTLDTKKGTLILTEIAAGKLAGRKSVKLPIYRTAPTVVRIGEVQYVFSLLP